MSSVLSVLFVIGRAKMYCPVASAVSAAAMNFYHSLFYLLSMNFWSEKRITVESGIGACTAIRLHGAEIYHAHLIICRSAHCIEAAVKRAYDSD